jgi:hypothetical protein
MAMAANKIFGDILEEMNRARERLDRATGINVEHLVSEDLPKQELLIKLLKMSTSPNDGEALISIRKANDLLKTAGWDWEKLIHGKIKVIEDPFKSVDVPLNRNAHSAPPPAPRPRPAPPPFNPPPPPRPAPPPQPKPAPKPHQPLSTKDNLYAGWCYCCGDPVGAKGGFIFDPAAHNRSAKSKWEICCNSCNNSTIRMIGATRAVRNRNPTAPSLNDI